MLTTLFRFASKKPPILSLTQLWLEGQRTTPPNFNISFTSPGQLYLEILKGLKMNVFFQQPEANKMVKLINEHIDDAEYLNQFIFILIPFANAFPALNQIYMKIANNYLAIHPNPSKEAVYYILVNLQRIIKAEHEDWTDNDWTDKDYSQQQKLAYALIPALMRRVNQFQAFNIANTTGLFYQLGILNSHFSAHLLNVLYDPSSRLSIDQIFMMLIYLSKAGYFPYEYYYSHQMLWAENIGHFKKYSNKKSRSSIQLLEIMVMENPPNSQKVIEKTLKILVEAVPSFDEIEVARVWYLINRAKFGTYKSLTEALLTKISLSVLNMQSIQLGLIVRGFVKFKISPSNREQCIQILKAVLQKFPSERPYEREIIRLILEKEEQLTQLKI